MVTMSATYVGPVALLNASYEPLGKVSFKQAMRMVARKVAAIEEAIRAWARPESWVDRRDPPGSPPSA